MVLINGVVIAANDLIRIQILIIAVSLNARLSLQLFLVFILGPAILEDVLIEVFRTLYTQCKAELDLQVEPSFNKDHTQLSRWIARRESLTYTNSLAENTLRFKSKLIK